MYGLRGGHDLLLKDQQVTAGEERSHFANTVAAPWNALSYEAVHARSVVNAFKDHIGVTGCLMQLFFANSNHLYY